MTQNSMIILFKTIVICLVLYSLALVYLYIFQSRMLYRPGSDNPFNHDYAPFVSLVYQTPAGMNMRGMWYPPKDHMPMIVYFQGNAGHIGGRLFKARKFIAKGYGIALVGYRGYSGNPGFPSEKNLMDDARAAIAALGQKGFPTSSMILYGESLGTGIAIRMASEYPDVKAVILEAPYTSIADIAARRFRAFPVNKLLSDRFESYKLIGALQMPILALHGTDDATTSVEIGHSLFSKATAKHKQFVSINGAGHNNLYDYGAEEMIDEFLAKTL